ncbi:hypothetical protein MesoLjLc_72420 [Mesorhizobium sp. L-8-10]|uniref:hypothetical protein n=1 Tax=Mesorhizobium sp. L-8-10 TaxID=2744523 RepID=UPI001927F769|nr:hypothetical protein [Mesorhizobium sp. L-8-10]BCH35312.1 hypothetical protein MesoLjLc_72420 [Mesorhizobium sp. L-8-10]
MAENDDLDRLLARMDEIAKAVNSFTSESVQQSAFDSLISAFAGAISSRASKRDVDSNSSPNDTEDREQLGKRVRKSQRKSRATDSSSRFDEVALLNSIKDDPRFERFRERIVLGNPTKVQQVKFVSWFAGETAITSGDMMRVLNGLGVKISQPDASKAVAAAKNDFIAGTKANTFRMSARAHADFEKWLLE